LSSPPQGFSSHASFLSPFTDLSLFPPPFHPIPPSFHILVVFFSPPSFFPGPPLLKLGISLFIGRLTELHPFLGSPSPPSRMSDFQAPPPLFCSPFLSDLGRGGLERLPGFSSNSFFPWRVPPVPLLCRFDFSNCFTSTLHLSSFLFSWVPHPVKELGVIRSVACYRFWLVFPVPFPSGFL